MSLKHNQFPAGDTQFEDHVLTGVELNADKSADLSFAGFGFGMPPTDAVVPKVGMHVRCYGKGFGATVRGLFIDGVKVYYRTETEDKEHSEIELYGRDAADWLQRWDAGRTVWTIEMGDSVPATSNAYISFARRYCASC